MKLPTIASILVSYHEADTAEPPSSRIIYDDSAVKWVASHSKMLYRHYPDRWILVGDKRVIASADDPNELFPIAEAQGIEAPFIARVVRPTKRKTMVYAK